MTLRRPLCGQQGTISLVAATGVLALCLTALAAADLGALLAARSRAQAAADGAALAAAVTQVSILGQTGEPATEARAYAARNGAEVLRCSCEPGDLVAEVEVAVRLRLSYVAPWFDRPVRAVARAAVDPDVLSYRDDG